MQNHGLDESYNFGNIVIDGKTYSQDLIVYPESIQDSWWRKEGHSLVPEDIPRVLELKPDVLVAGTGASGMLTVPKSTREYLLSLGIEIVAAPTERAARHFNKLKDKKLTVGAFNLTC